MTKRNKILDPQRLLEVVWDGDRSLRFDALYNFIRDHKLQQKFFDYVKKDFFEACPPDEVEAEWARILIDVRNNEAEEAP